MSTSRHRHKGRCSVGGCFAYQACRRLPLLSPDRAGVQGERCALHPQAWRPPSARKLECRPNQLPGHPAGRPRFLVRSRTALAAHFGPRPVRLKSWAPCARFWVSAHLGGSVHDLVWRPPVRRGRGLCSDRQPGAAVERLPFRRGSGFPPARSGPMSSTASTLFVQRRVAASAARHETGPRAGPPSMRRLRATWRSTGSNRMTASGWAAEHAAAAATWRSTGSNRMTSWPRPGAGTGPPDVRQQPDVPGPQPHQFTQPGLPQPIVLVDGLVPASYAGPCPSAQYP